MILVVGARPGTVIFLDTLAPAASQAAVDLLLGIARESWRSSTSPSTAS
jgi:hypothetical protein